jgi:hypothetical protein
MPELRLGKKPATTDHRDLKFASYLTAKLPTPPRTFGHEKLIGADQWDMLGNDRAGCCVFSGAGHETMLWTKAAGNPVQFSDRSVLSDYAAVTGFDPITGSGDNGTNVRDALKYRAKTGILDSVGRRHKIGAYVALEPGNWTHLLAALYLFGAVGIGIEFPASAMDQFNAGKNWSVVRGSSIEGGHYVPLVGRRSVTRLVTWGQCIGMTQGFYLKYCDESWAILSPEYLKAGRSLEGFSLAQLQADLKAL